MTGSAGDDDMAADTMLIFMEQPDAEPELEPEPDPVVARLDPPPKGFQVVTPPIDIPTEIPPIDLDERFDPRDFTGDGIEGGIFPGEEGGTGPVDLSQTFMEAWVDERPERLSCPPPQYPELLRQAGIEGTVVIQAVVDTTGRIERNSIEIIRADHRRFETPASELLMRCLYRPGRIRGLPVRVLIQQSIRFGITR